MIPGLAIAATALGCSSGSLPEPIPVVVPATQEGERVDGGFGSALAASGPVVWVGAPHGDTGRVYRLQGEDRVLVMEGVGRLGSAVATTPHGPIAGAPLANDGDGAVLGPTGEPVLLGGGNSTGLALAGGANWIAATADGWVAADGTTGSSPARPTSVATRGSTVGVGMARGEIALSDGIVQVARPRPQDEAGFALAVGDVDDDGSDEWILGAPGASVVFLVPLGASEPSRTLSDRGSGRYGASVAVADVDGDGIDDLVVGAPVAGTSGEGEVVLYTGGDLERPARSWRGNEPWDQLGTAVGAAPGFVAMGAPGGAGALGYVRVESP